MTGNGKGGKPAVASMLQGFLTKAKESDCERIAAAEDVEGHRHLQVRLTLRDAKRFRCLSDYRGLTMQDALVAGINALMADWGEAPVGNPGARGKKEGGGT